MSVKKIRQKDLQLANHIKKTRKKAGVTQEQLATRTGLSTTFIGLLEIAQRKPSLKSLEKIAKALSVHVKDLFPF